MKLNGKMVYCKNIEEATEIFNYYKRMNYSIKGNTIIFKIKNRIINEVKFLDEGIVVDVDYAQWFSLDEVKLYEYENLVISFSEWEELI